MVVSANIVKNQAISVDLNQKVGGFNAPVKSVNSKTGDVILDANDVGAISKDELQATTNEILTQAKESGVFDGPQGPQGEKGEKGDKGDTGLTGPQGPAGSDANVTAENIDRALGYTPADHIALEELTRRLNALADSDDVTLDQVSELVAYIKANRELIESVTTNKVNVSDIIDNLTTNVSNKPLSAARGAVLKGLINDLENNKANQTGLDELSDWTHQAVDEIVEFVSKDSNIESAFNLVSSNTLNWNGDTTGKLISVNSKDSSMSYVRVSSAIPTLEELQKGGTWAIIGDDGVEYEEPFTSDNIVENDNLIVGVDGYFLVAKEDNVQYIEGTDINVVLPKAGTYFIYFGADGYMSRLSVTEYTGFTKSILKMESLTLHQHDWYGKAVVGGNTVRGDETLQGKWVKVSDEVPTEAEINNGGVVRYYNVTDDVISDEIITGYYPSDDYVVTVKDEGIIIRYGFEFLVVISFNGSSSIGGVTFEGIDSPGVYFKQVGQSCVHSFTINGYTKFSYNVEKIPFELIPEGIGGGVTSWNDLTDRPFGETTVMGDTLTWDGDTDGLYSFAEMWYCVSDIVPTMEELQKGGSFVANGTVIPFDESSILDTGTGTIVLNELVLVVTVANATLEGVPLEKAGIYLPNMENMLVTSLTINDYTNLKGTVINKIDSKFLPERVLRIGTVVDGTTFTTDKTFEEVLAAHKAGLSCILNGGESLYHLHSISEDDAVFVGFYHDGSASITVRVAHMYKDYDNTLQRISLSPLVDGV